MTDVGRRCSTAVSYADLGWAVLPYVKLPNGGVRFDGYEMTKLLHPSTPGRSTVLEKGACDV